MRAMVFALFAAVTLLVGCGAEPSEQVAADEVGVEAQALPTSTNVFCPTGFSFDATYRLCVSSTEAVGPFTQSMVTTCQNNGGGTGCTASRWAVGFARSIRGTGSCMPGSTVDTTIDACAEGTNAFGPFSVTQVNHCKSVGGGTACESMRIAKTMLPRVATTTNPLTVPYFYQYFNTYEPSGTCGITSASMLLNYYNKGVTPDGLYTRFGKAQGQSPEGLAYIYRQYGLSAQSTYTGTEAMIKRQIDAGRPVVIHGWFTGPGHIMVVIGYNSTGWVMNDPSGLWAGCYACGYPNRTSTNGKGVTYSYSSVRSVAGPDGDYWLSTAGTSAFSL